MPFAAASPTTAASHSAAQSSNPPHQLAPPSYYLLPIGTGLMTVVVLYRFLVYLTGAKSGLGEVPTLEKAAGPDVTPEPASADGQQR